MFAKKTLITLSAGALLAAAVPAFAQQASWGDGYRSRDTMTVQYRSARGLTFDQWAASTRSPYGKSWAQKLAEDREGAEFGDGERERLEQARAEYRAAGGGTTAAERRAAEQQEYGYDDRPRRRGWRDWF